MDNIKSNKTNNVNTVKQQISDEKQKNVEDGWPPKPKRPVAGLGKKESMGSRSVAVGPMSREERINALKLECQSIDERIDRKISDIHEEIRECKESITKYNEEVLGNVELPEDIPQNAEAALRNIGNDDLSFSKRVFSALLIGLQSIDCEESEEDAFGELMDRLSGENSPVASCVQELLEEFQGVDNLKKEELWLIAKSAEDKLNNMDLSVEVKSVVMEKVLDLSEEMLSNVDVNSGSLVDKDDDLEKMDFSMHKSSEMLEVIDDLGDLKTISAGEEDSLEPMKESIKVLNGSLEEVLKRMDEKFSIDVSFRSEFDAEYEKILGMFGKTKLPKVAQLQLMEAKTQVSLIQKIDRLMVRFSLVSAGLARDLSNCVRMLSSFVLMKISDLFARGLDVVDAVISFPQEYPMVTGMLVLALQVLVSLYFSGLLV